MENTLKKLNKIYLFFRNLSNAKVEVFTSDNKKHENHMGLYKNYFYENKKIIQDDYCDALTLYNHRNTKEKDQVNLDLFQGLISQEIRNVNEIMRHIVNIHIFFRLYNMQNYEEISASDIDKMIDREDNDNDEWYRGQVNNTWQLVPSFFRNQNTDYLWKWPDI